MNTAEHQLRPFRLGVAGPVGAGKTALVQRLCEGLRDTVDMVVVTNDLFTDEDALFLRRHAALHASRIVAVQTGGCPHTAIREDITPNLAAVRTLQRRFPSARLVIIESGGDNLAATFSRALADAIVFVIDVTGGDKVPRKGGPGTERSDLLVVNKIDLAPLVGADVEVMRRDAEARRDGRPIVMTDLRAGIGVDAVRAWVVDRLRVHERDGAVSVTADDAESHAHEASA